MKTCKPLVEVVYKVGSRQKTMLHRHQPTSRFQACLSKLFPQSMPIKASQSSQRHIPYGHLFVLNVHSLNPTSLSRPKTRHTSSESVIHHASFKHLSFWGGGAQVYLRIDRWKRRKRQYTYLSFLSRVTHFTYVISSYSDNPVKQVLFNPVLQIPNISIFFVLSTLCHILIWSSYCCVHFLSLQMQAL